MTERLVNYRLEDGVAFIGLDRGAKRNALNSALLAQAHTAIERAQGEARVGLIYSESEHFSAGLDLAEALEQMQSGEWRGRHFTAQPPALVDLIARGAVPFVAALAGAVVGGGFEIAAAAHIRVADTTAYFALPEGKRGIFVGGGGSVRIARLIGTARMMDLMLTGRVYTAREAEVAGAVQYLVEPGEALAKATELAATLATNAPASNFAITNGLPRIQDLGYEDGLFFERLLALATWSDESNKRLENFVQKRAEPLRVGDAVPGERNGAS